MVIAADRNFGNHQELNTEENRIYIGQIVKFLEVVYLATKQFESENVPTISMVVPIILNTLVNYEDPQVNLRIEVNIKFLAVKCF